MKMCDLGKQNHMIMIYLLIIFCLNSIASGVGPNEVIIWDAANFHGISYSWTWPVDLAVHPAEKAN